MWHQPHPALQKETLLLNITSLGFRARYPCQDFLQLLHCFGFIPSHIPVLPEQSQLQELSRRHSINERAAEV